MNHTKAGAGLVPLLWENWGRPPSQTQPCPASGPLSQTNLIFALSCPPHTPSPLLFPDSEILDPETANAYLQVIGDLSK